ncbi:MAG: hypothetical protein HYY18_15000 [Planctomycetes bacterium]|nr:hypothetical protein [Planctomycetota bacterium]
MSSEPGTSEGPCAPLSETETPDPVVEAYGRDVDRTLLRENLRLTPEQRLLNLIELQRFAEELRAAGRRLVQA